MDILFTICGRAGSKGIHNKNLRRFCNKYLLYYSVAVIDLYLAKHPEIDYDLVVNSDSMELLRLAAVNGMLEIEQIVRNESLAGDTVGKIDVIRNCLEIMQDRKHKYYNMVVDLDITSPLRRVRDLEKVIALQNETKADVVTTVATARRNPYFNQIKRTEHGFRKVIESKYTARQQAPEIFDMNASIYAYNPTHLFSGKAVLDGYVEAVEMYDTGILDLDHENDFDLMEVIAGYLFRKEKDFQEVYAHVPV